MPALSGRPDYPSNSLVTASPKSWLLCGGCCFLALGNPIAEHDRSTPNGLCRDPLQGCDTQVRRMRHSVPRLVAFQNIATIFRRVPRCVYIFRRWIYEKIP